MPFCPQCKAEYVELVGTCPDCKTALVPELPIEQVELVDWVTVYQAPTELAASMVKGILDNRELQSTIRPNVVPGYVIPGSWYQAQWGEVLVPNESMDEAKEIIQEYLDGLPYDDNNPEPEVTDAV